MPKYIITLFIFFSICIFTQTQLSNNKSISKKRDLFARTEKIKYFHFGFNESLADTFWVNFIQILGTCHYEDNKISNKDCNYSESYDRLNTIVNLAPKFELPATRGPKLLSVIEDDIKGASKIYDLTVSRFPKNLQALISAGAHFATEENNSDKAAEIFKKAGEIEGSMFWLNTLSAKLYSEAGKKEIALTMLYDLLNKTDNTIHRERIMRRIISIKK
jgi:hypothetical protein